MCRIDLDLKFAVEFFRCLLDLGFELLEPVVNLFRDTFVDLGGGLRRLNLGRELVCHCLANFAGGHLLRFLFAARRRMSRRT